MHVKAGGAPLGIILSAEYGKLFSTSEDAMRTDSETRKDVEDELRLDPDIDATHVAVAVHNGGVTLTGVMHSWLQKTQAGRDAMRVVGPLGVANDIQVRLPHINTRPDPEIVRDAAEKLQNELPYSSQFIKGTAMEGWLTLEGALEWNYQRERAEKAVGGVRGVIGTTNEVVLKPRIPASDIKCKIEDALQRRAELDAEGITVEAMGSKATLRGCVRSWADRTEAE